LVAEDRGVSWPEGRLFGHRLGDQLLHGHVVDLDAAFGEEFFDVAVGQAEA
jgi:hypothetical protein